MNQTIIKKEVRVEITPLDILKYIDNEPLNCLRKLKNCVEARINVLEGDEDEE